MIKHSVMLALGAALSLGWPGGARAANLDELSKYLAFIDGFQHLFEFCQAEAKLPADEVNYARQHIGERRALIFAGLSPAQRDKITTDSQPKKKRMLDGVMGHVRKTTPNTPLKQLCKEGFFAGVIESEKGSEEKERAAIRKAKD
jgi:hypothetical protein